MNPRQRLALAAVMHERGASANQIAYFMHRGTPEHQIERDARDARLRRAYPHIFALQPIPEHRPQHAPQDADDGS